MLDRLSGGSLILCSNYEGQIAVPFIGAMNITCVGDDFRRLRAPDQPWMASPEEESACHAEGAEQQRRKRAGLREDNCAGWGRGRKHERNTIAHSDSRGPSQVIRPPELCLANLVHRQYCLPTSWRHRRVEDSSDLDRRKDRLHQSIRCSCQVRLHRDRRRCRRSSRGRR
jgi:hypothetical protein